MQQIIESNAEFAVPCPQQIVGRDRLGASKDHARLQMVLQIFADADQRLDNVDSETAQQIGGSDSGKLKDLRRLQRTGRDDHFAPRCGAVIPSALSIDNRARASLFEFDARSVRIGLDIEIRPRPCRPQVRRRSRATHAVTRRELVVARTFLRCTVEIRVPRNADFHRRVDKCLDQRMAVSMSDAHSGPSSP